MNISQNCIDLIKKWESFIEKAAFCPAGVLSIGYGTTFYPDGSKISAGDTTTKEEAEGFLLLSAQKFAETVAKAVTIDLTQNQFDAVTSFVYNIGEGAFLKSTLLKELNLNKIEVAANEFLRWDKITKSNGEKVSLKGLTDRRNEEKALFLNNISQATQILLREIPTQESVTWMEGFSENGKNVVVAYGGSKVVEIAVLESSGKKDLIDLLNQYTGGNYHTAPNNKKIPDGERVLIKRREILAVKSTPAITKAASLNIEANSPTPKSYLRLVKTKEKDQHGCYVLRLNYYENNILVDFINVCSGSPRSQFFRKGVNSKAGSMEPIPEGIWRVEDIKWAKGRDDWSGSYGSGIGAASVPLTYISPGKTARSAIEGHEDFNRRTYPGTAGCIGFYTRDNFKKFITEWLRKTNPRELICDWGLGSV